MTSIDWVILVGTIVVVVATGFLFRRYVRSVRDFLLAGRTQKWYIIGPNCQATQADVADYLGCAGFAYQHGSLGLTTYSVHLPLSWWFASWTIIPQMYRSGVYTPAEFLELRFNYAARFWGGLLIWLQRVYVMGSIMMLMGMTLEIIIQTRFMTGLIIAGAFCLVYTLVGGLSAAMVTGTAQLALMTLTSWVLFFIGLHHFGGWANMLSQTAANMVRHAMSGELIPVSFWNMSAIPSATWMPAGMAFIGILFATGSYAMIQAEQIARPLGARSEVDARLGFISAGPICMLHQFAIIWIGTMGVLAYGYMAPALNPAAGGRPDAVWAMMVRDLLPPGILGLILAGVAAATLSTVPSNAQSCAGILTRDIYARIIRRDAPESHYLLVARLFTVVNFGLGLLFIPFIQRGGGYIVMWTKITGALISPLLAVMVWATLIPMLSRWSAFISMIAGGVFGSIIAFGGSRLFPEAPLLYHWSTVPLWNFIFATAVMLAVSAVENAKKGRMTDQELEGYVWGTFPPQVKPYLDRRAARISAEGMVEETGVPIYGTAGLPWYKNPRFWTVAELIGIAVWVVVWW